MTVLHQYPSTETRTSSETYPGIWPNPSTIGRLVTGIRKNAKIILVRLNP